MLTAIKTVSDAIVGILTLLLQVIVFQLERQPASPEEDPENPPEILQTMESMIQELHNQREMLQNLQQSMQQSQTVRNSRNDPARRALPAASSTPRDSRMSTRPSQAAPTLLNEAFRQAHQVSAPRPDFDQQSRGGTSTRTWAFVEEEEAELILDQDGRNLLESPPTPSLRGLPSASPTPTSAVGVIGLPERPLSLVEWGQKTISWGRKHKGRNYLQVLREDPGYYAWSLARFASLPANQQDFVKFCQVQLDVDRATS